MKVASYKLKYGTSKFYPKSIQKYIHARVEALSRRLQRELGDDYAVYMNPSDFSEAAYIRIRHRRTDVNYTIGFKSHGDFGRSATTPDKIVRLSSFETWKECKEVFLKRMMPYILHAMSNEKLQERMFEKDLRMHLHDMMDEVLSGGVRV